MTKRLGATSVAVIPFLWQPEITVTVLDCTPQVRHGIPRKLKPVATYDDKRSALCPGASAGMAEFERPAGSRWISHQYRDATQLLSPIPASISSISKLSRSTMQGMPNVGSQLRQNSNIRKCDWLVRKKNFKFWW